MFVLKLAREQLLKFLKKIIFLYISPYKFVFKGSTL
jgi:hypothetical protein